MEGVLAGYRQEENWCWPFAEDFHRLGLGTPNLVNRPLSKANAILMSTSHWKVYPGRATAYCIYPMHARREGKSTSQIIFNRPGKTLEKIFYSNTRFHADSTQSYASLMQL